MIQGGLDLILNARLRQSGDDFKEAGGSAGGPTDGKRWRQFGPKAGRGDKRIDDLVEGRSDAKLRWRRC